MTKFEEEAMNEFAKSEYIYTAYDGTFRGETDGTVMEFAKGTAIYTFPWLEFAKNWHSDEEYQELLEQKDERILKLENENSFMRDERTTFDSNGMAVEPKLQQQALPVVPEDVDKAIKYLKKHVDSTFIELGDILTEKGFKWLNDFQFKDRRFGFGGLNNKLFILSHLAVTGYTVEKPKLFYLREKNTGYYLRKTGNNEYGITPHYSNDYDEKYMHYKFTQQEIGSMQTGSYEQIEVKE